MSEKPFVVNDRRKFTADGELRPDAVLNETSREPVSTPESADDAGTTSGPQLVQSPDQPAAATAAEDQPADPGEQQQMPPLTSEQIEGAARAYESTAERLDTAMRAADPGGDRMPPMSFGTLVQSLYMQTILQLGGGTETGQQPRIDLLGARQTIDMLAVVADKTSGNLGEDEQRLIDSALFEMRMGFLDVTQALARQAASRTQGPGDPNLGPNAGPQMVR